MTHTRNLATGCLLGIFGLLCTAFRWELPLSFNLDLIFGPVFVMLAILQGGPVAGLVAGALTYAPMLVLYGNPWWFLVFLLEPLIVGWATRNRRERLVMFDVLYWLLGAPLLWLACTKLLGLQPESAQLWIAKQLINSALNALIATVGVLTIRLLLKPDTSRPPFGVLVFCTLLTVVLVPSVTFLVLTIRDNADHHRAQTTDLASYVLRRAESLLEPGIRAYVGGDRTGLLQSELTAVANRLSADLTLLAQADRVLASTVADVVPGTRFTRFDQGERISLPNGVEQWIPSARPGQDQLQRWWHSTFVARAASVAGTPMTLVVELPGESYVREVNRSAINYCTTLALFVCGIVGASGWLSRRLTRPVVELQYVTGRLQHRMKASAADATWPRSHIREVQDLIDDVRDFNLTLERRVDERSRALEVSEARYREVLDGLQLLALQLDAAGRITYVNEFTLKLTGYTRGELQDRNWFETCLPAPEAAVVKSVFEASMARNEAFPSSYENRIVTRKRESRLVAWNNVTVRGSDGRMIGTTSIGTDITEARAAQQALQESEARFSHAFRNAPLLVTLSDPVTGRFTDANDTFLQVLGMTRDQVVGRTPIELGISPPGERERMVAALARDGRVTRYERAMHLPDGTDRAIRYWGEVIDIGGRRALLSMAEDITDYRAVAEERARLEDQLKQARQLESVGRLAGGVAHDFNNNLTTMMMQLSMLLHDSRTPPPVRASLEEVMAAAKRSADLTRQLLMFGRKSILKKEPLDLHQVIISLLEMLRRVLGETIDVAFDSPGALPSVMADRSLVEQSVLNLAINAKDAMPEGGTLRIGLADLHVSDDAAQQMPGARAGHFVRLTFSDTGVGMDDAVRARLFEPFFTTKATGSGTGLGLASVHGLVVQHKGWIEVESSPGAGASFTLYLPVGPAS